MSKDRRASASDHGEESKARSNVAADALALALVHQIQDLSAHADERLSYVVEGLRQTLSAIDKHLSNQMTQIHEHLSERIPQTLVEQRFLQNRSFSRDNLPSSLAIKQYYLQMKALKEKVDFDEIGLSIFSQNNEDGILMYIFSRIGFASKRCIEIGCDLSSSTVGIPEGNTINLISNFAFDGLIVDMDPGKAAAIRNFFAQALTTKHLHAPASNDVPARYFSPTILAQEVTIENINSVFQDAEFAGEVDLLSIDVDGSDVLMWEAVQAVSPRVMMIEINARIPFEDIVYGHASRSKAPTDSLEFQAARSSSLAAACEVAEKKNYVFIGMDATLLNAFFLRRDAWTSEFPERRPSDYTDHRMNPLRYVAGFRPSET